MMNINREGLAALVPMYTYILHVDHFVMAPSPFNIMKYKSAPGFRLIPKYLETTLLPAIVLYGVVLKSHSTRGLITKQIIPLSFNNK